VVREGYALLLCLRGIDETAGVDEKKVLRTPAVAILTSNLVPTVYLYVDMYH
jgi:hypothetical protein